MSDLGTTAGRDARADLLRAFGASGEVLEELLTYTANPFAGPDDRAVPAFPLADEVHIARWRLYETEARELGALSALKRRFVQLRFPIQEGINRRSRTMPSPSSCALHIRVWSTSTRSPASITASWTILGAWAA